MIEVVGAIFIKEGKLFAVKRGKSKNPEASYKYEFAGGKVELNESREAALVRELKEELDLDARVNSHFLTVEHEYKMYSIRLHVYLCTMLSTFILKEHIAYEWIPLHLVNAEEFAPADVLILEKLKSLYL